MSTTMGFNIQEPEFEDGEEADRACPDDHDIGFQHLAHALPCLPARPDH